MTTSVNPMVHLKHAWENTHSMWGKWTIVLFYLFIWVNVILSFIWLVWPTCMGVDCFWKNESEYAVSTNTTMVREVSLWSLGFFLYADRGGIRFWNVTMVFVFSMIFMWFSWTWANDWTSMEGAPKHCDDGGMATRAIIGMVWIALTWILSFVEHRAGHSAGGSGGTTNESTPLTA